MTKFKVGDKVRYIGKGFKFNEYVTKGRIYEINKIDGDGDAQFIDDSGSNTERSFITDRTARQFEIVTEQAEATSDYTAVEASPTVIELLANISRRLYEAEQTIKEQAYEINELYKAVAERG